MLPSGRFTESGLCNILEWKLTQKEERREMDSKGGTNDILHGSIWKQLILFGVPVLIGNLLQQLYNTVDSVIVGRYVSNLALAAVGSTTLVLLYYSS